jgi:CSLREA domain-containing protein
MSLGRIAVLFTVVPFVLLLGLIVAPIELSRAAVEFTVNDVEDWPDANIGDGNCASAHLGLCTLRAAIQEAQHAGGGVIYLTPLGGVGPFSLTIPSGAENTGGSPDNATGDLDIGDLRLSMGSDPPRAVNIRVVGYGVDVSVIDGTGTHRIFDVHPGGSLWLENLTVQNGRGDVDQQSGHEHGGAIHNHGNLTLDRVAVINSSSPPGWGGGGITNAITGVANMQSVTVARNTAALRGGGIENLGELRMLGVTVAENWAPLGEGGGIFVNPSATMFAAATLVATNAGGDCTVTGGTVTSSGGNLAGGADCGFNTASDLRDDPWFDWSVLGPPLFYPLLASSTGPTSKAVDTGFACPALDIRGVTRGLDGNGDGVAKCDTGSYESPTVPVPTCNGQTATISVDTQGVIFGKGPYSGKRYGGKLWGTSGNDVIVGTSGRDHIRALAGNDIVCGGDGDDLLEAGDGKDAIQGGLGADDFDGGTGKDIANDFFAPEGDTKTAVENW